MDNDRQTPHPLYCLSIFKNGRAALDSDQPHDNQRLLCNVRKQKSSGFIQAWIKNILQLFSDFSMIKLYYSLTKIPPLDDQKPNIQIIHNCLHKVLCEVDAKSLSTSQVKTSVNLFLRFPCLFCNIWHTLKYFMTFSSLEIFISNSMTFSIFPGLYKPWKMYILGFHGV